MKCLDCNKTIHLSRRIVLIGQQGIIDLLNTQPVKEGQYSVCPKCEEIGVVDADLNFKPLSEDEINRNILTREDKAPTILLDLKEAAMKRNNLAEKHN